MREIPLRQYICKKGERKSKVVLSRAGQLHRDLTCPAYGNCWVMAVKCCPLCLLLSCCQGQIHRDVTCPACGNCWVMAVGCTWPLLSLESDWRLLYSAALPPHVVVVLSRAATQRPDLSCLWKLMGDCCTVLHSLHSLSFRSVKTHLQVQLDVTLWSRCLYNKTVNMIIMGAGLVCTIITVCWTRGFNWKLQPVGSVLKCADCHPAVYWTFSKELLKVSRKRHATHLKISITDSGIGIVCHLLVFYHSQCHIKRKSPFLPRHFAWLPKLFYQCLFIFFKY